MHKLCFTERIPDLVTFIFIVYYQKLFDDNAEDKTREHTLWLNSQLKANICLKYSENAFI